MTMSDTVANGPRSERILFASSTNGRRVNTPVRSSFGPVTVRSRTVGRSPAFDSTVTRGLTDWRARPHHLLEQREERRIELRADVDAHDLHCRVVRERALVAPSRRQRIVDVGDAEHARRQRNLLAGDLLRVSLAIPSLVVVPHHRNDVGREIHVGEHLDARRRMSLHQLPFVGRQPARLVQEL